MEELEKKLQILHDRQERGEEIWIDFDDRRKEDFEEFSGPPSPAPEATGYVEYSDTSSESGSQSSNFGFSATYIVSR